MQKTITKLQEYIEKIESAYGLPSGSIICESYSTHPKRKINNFRVDYMRNILSYIMRVEYGMRVFAISEILGYSNHSGASQGLRIVRDYMSKNDEDFMLYYSEIKSIISGKKTKVFQRPERRESATIMYDIPTVVKKSDNYSGKKKLIRHKAVYSNQKWYNLI